ncbi:hypothetical protein [Streptomyces sp. NPDC058092]|uniref:hypothetical protein n=1 Tax=Streptomyces sp. NPDC058092 TaxID=3346336 RepID=UPI0036E41C75
MTATPRCCRRRWTLLPAGGTSSRSFPATSRPRFGTGPEPQSANCSPTASTGCWTASATGGSHRSTRTKRREEAPPEVAAILKWIERNTLSMAAWEEPARVEAVLNAVSSLLDGTPAAASSAKRNRRILNVAMEYAVKHRILRSNPLPKGRGTSPKMSSAVDKRALLNRGQAARLLGWVRLRPRGGQRLHAFFATMYYAGPRPEEAVAMVVHDVRLPDEDAEDQWGELLFHTASQRSARRDQ